MLMSNLNTAPLVVFKTRERGSEMQKVIVFCNVPHIIEPGVCALCERDEAKGKIEAAEEMAKALKITKASFKVRSFQKGGVNYGGDKITISQEAADAIEAAFSAWEKAGKGEG